MKYREVVRKLSVLGCQERARKGGGSHRKWIDPISRQAAVIPDWGNRDLKMGTIRACGSTGRNRLATFLRCLTQSSNTNYLPSWLNYCLNKVVGVEKPTSTQMVMIRSTIGPSSSQSSNPTSCLKSLALLLKRLMGLLKRLANTAQKQDGDSTIGHRST